MSAFGGKADVRELPSVCLLIARSGHSSIPHLTPKVQAETASVTVDESHTPKYPSFIWLHIILSWVYIAVANKTPQGGTCNKCQEVVSARSEALGAKFVPPMGWMKRSALMPIDL